MEVKIVRSIAEYINNMHFKIELLSVNSMLSGAVHVQVISLEGVWALPVQVYELNVT